MEINLLENKNVLLGVTGSIAAHKALMIATLLKHQGCNVKTILTKSACEFVNPKHFEAQTDNICYTDMFDHFRKELKKFQKKQKKPFRRYDLTTYLGDYVNWISEISTAGEAGTEHISLPKWADVFLIAPATANFISKIAYGIADDLLTTTFLSIYDKKKHKKIIIAPAMNTRMYKNPITQKNIKTIKSIYKDDVTFIPPKKSMLACGEEGIGALADITKIVDETIIKLVI